MFKRPSRPSGKNPATLVLRAASQRPAVVAAKATEVLVPPMLIGRNASITLPDAMRHLVPVAVSNLHGGTTPRSNGNPILRFPILCHDDGKSFEILPDSGTDQTAYFDFFQFGRLGEKEFEVCYSSSLGAHGNLLVDFKRRKAYWRWLAAGSALDAKNPHIETLVIRYSGLLDPGCLIKSATLPCVTKFENNQIHFSTGTAPLKLNDELCALTVAEIVGSGILFSLTDPEATFRYDNRRLQHFFIALTHPKKILGKMYYGGKTTVFSNLGESRESEIVDMHQALLRVLFGLVNKPLREELDIQHEADVFLGLKELQEYLAATRVLLTDPERLGYASQDQALDDFVHCADLLSGFAEKLEDKDETALIQCECLFGKSGVCMAREDAAGAQALVGQIVARAGTIVDEAKRKELHAYFEANGWQVGYEEIFGG
jgi:hypothetical protein